MSIRLKLYVGCLALTLLTAMLGCVALLGQKQIAGMTATIYDEAYLAMSYLRSAQNTLLAADGRFHGGAGEPGLPPDAGVRGLLDALPDVVADLQVAVDRALSPLGRAKTSAIRDQLASLATASSTPGRADIERRLEAAEAALDTAVEIYAGDGYRFRRDVDRLIERSTRQTFAAIGLSVLIGLVIMQILVRAILPSISHAVRVAQAISAGRLDNRITAEGRSETALLLRALAGMQNSIAGNIARIEELRERQVSSYAERLSVQYTRFDAALRHMTQALCMFDGEQRLVVFNRRFVELFGEPEIGQALDRMPVEAELLRTLSSTVRDFFIHEMGDGRVVEVAKQPVDGGGWVATFEDVTERSRAEARLAHMARHDALTGLPNRFFFRERLAHLLSDDGGGPRPTVFCLDLDGFKQVNDSLGHPVGDALLKAVADRLLASVQGDDMVARIGGDEFAVLHCVAPGSAESQHLARRIVDALGRPFEIDGQRIAIGVSIGIETAWPNAEGRPKADVETLLKNSDIALYRAKAEKGGTFRFFEAEMDERIQSRRRLELDLRSALERQEIEIFYQPFVDLGRGAVTGFEALVRWQHPERGRVSPADFIPLAEEVGLIDEIGAVVLRQACAQAAAWPDTIGIAVNLSPVQFRNPSLVEEVERVLRETGLRPNRLQLEVTESLLLQDTASVLSMLKGLRALGVGISMDDFGTGYSSLSYLRRFPFDKIKIDQSFVRDLTQSDNLAIVRAVISMGRAMGIAVLAEGVETAEQASILMEEGCLELQGYLFSQPCPVSALPKLLLGMPQHLDDLATRAEPARLSRRVLLAG